jgi:hypothetical protein
MIPLKVCHGPDRSSTLTVLRVLNARHAGEYLVWQEKEIERVLLERALG